MSGQSGGHRLRLSKLNDQLTCKLCGGYFIDATTIIECLHSFCRSCIVKYLENNKYCPICEVQVHKSKPLLNIRPDHTLQDIVYKLVPGCYQNEMRCRREFYSKHPDACGQASSPEARGEPTESHIYSPDESLSLSLEYFSGLKDGKGIAVKPLLRRYFRCPAAVTIFHLQKLIRAKYGLTDAHRVDVMYKEEPLCSTYTLMDVMYIYHWRRKVPLHLSYRIFESSPKRIKLSEDNVNYKASLFHAGIDPIGIGLGLGLDSKEGRATKREWKEVQLKISETGIMSITDITDQQFKKNARIEEPLPTLETINASVVEESAGNKNAGSEIDKENEKSADKQTVAEGDVSSKSSKLEQRDCNETETANPLTKETENPTNSEEETKARLDNNNVEDNKAILDNNKGIQSAEATQGTNQNEIRNNNVESKDQKEPPKNNNNITAESKVAASKQNSRSDAKFANTGSKINALSVKLQFQPKAGQIGPNSNNNTNNPSSLKKAAKDKKVVAQSSNKKVEAKPAENSKGIAESKNSLDAAAEAQAVTNNCATATSKALIACPAKGASQKSGSESQESAESGGPLYPSTSVNSESKEAERNTKNVQSMDREGSCCQVVEAAEKKYAPSDQASAESQRTNGQANTFPQKSPYVNDALASLNLSTSLSSSVGNGIHSTSTSTATLTSTVSQCTSTFPYTVQNLVNSAMLKNSLKSLPPATLQKSENECSVSVSVSESPAAFTIPPMSSTSSYPSTSTSSSASKGNMEMASAYSVPPCPGAIPISLMKPPIRKNDSIAKGSTLNEICAKIGASGSKINDICAKIGENSKEKNKTEARNKSEIPDLLKIGRKNGSSSIAVDSGKAQTHASIPNVPVYAPNSSAIPTEGKNIYSNVKDSLRATSLVSSSPVASSHPLPKVLSVSKKQSQAMGYKTLRDPPKCWNPTLSKNNYVAVKNQSKETQNQLHQSALFERSKTIQSKPAKIFKMRNMPRYLGNPASGVKPMYGIGNECKEQEQLTITSTATTTNTSSSSKNGNLSMMKIDPKTLSPIVSTVNSPIVSPPPYSPSARNYPNPQFSRDICRSTGSPISPKNSPVNMLSTSPFIPSPTPNMNPRLIYPHFPPPFPDATRFPNPLIRSPIGIPSPSAFHSSLPPSINKLYQRSSYIPQTTGFSSVSQPPTVQRIPPTTYSSPKSPKTTSLTAISPASYGLVKQETQPVASSHESGNMLLAENSAQEDVSAFNLSKTGNFCNAETIKTPPEAIRASSKSASISPSSNVAQSAGKNALNSKVKAEQQGDHQDRSKEQPQKETGKGSKEQNLSAAKPHNSEGDAVNTKKEEKPSSQINGDASSESRDEKTEKLQSEKKEQSEAKVTQISEKKLEAAEKAEVKKEGKENSEEQQQSKSETQASKAEV